MSNAHEVSETIRMYNSISLSECNSVVIVAAATLYTTELVMDSCYVVIAHAQTYCIRLIFRGYFISQKQAKVGFTKFSQFLISRMSINSQNT